MFRFDINTAKMIFLFDGAEEVFDFKKSGERKTNDSGIPQFKINAIARTPGDRASQSIAVKVYSRKNPADDISLYAQIKFEGLAALVYEMNGKTGVSFSADSVARAQAAK
ncbi:hypothetical protein [Eggerthella sp. YY7918]|uniref:hypothetical protein n=1 Tax=Eggerthella sp. (strain YY7918) TaxID=502558 RepID=UPI0002170F78|nr:hypothetical protein [Eggerthella sp. YY7918]BAK43301.1 hypothetical protein EGYY_00180 [Eggerthella sp. YY7918]